MSCNLSEIGNNCCFVIKKTVCGIDQVLSAGQQTMLSPGMAKYIGLIKSWSMVCQIANIRRIT